MPDVPLKMAMSPQVAQALLDDAATPEERAEIEKLISERLVLTPEQVRDINDIRAMMAKLMKQYGVTPDDNQTRNDAV